MKKLWFKRKLYGWGWTPSTWEGWLVIFGYIGFLALIVKDITAKPETPPDLSNFPPSIIVLTALLIITCYLKGEKPRWQWGKDLGDKKKKS